MKVCTLSLHILQGFAESVKHEIYCVPYMEVKACAGAIDPFLSIRFPWYYWRSSAEAWRSGSVVA